MTHQQELELLAEWIGKDLTGFEWRLGSFYLPERDHKIGAIWNPSPTGNSDDFLNMVAGRVDIEFYPRLHPVKAIATARVGLASFIAGRTFDLYNNDKLAAMKHAAYQVCLMAAKEWKEAAR